MTAFNRGAGRPLAKPIPERIKEAREARGFTPEDFAIELGVSRQALAQYETGQITPSGTVMSAIIALTAQPHSFFTTQRNRTGDGIRPFWRSLKRMDSKHRRRIARRLEWAYDICEYLNQFIELPHPHIKAANHDFLNLSDEDIEKSAEDLRDAWGLGREPIRDLTSILEKNGVVLICETVSCDDMDAVSCWQGGRPFILYSSEVKSWPRRAFNLAHELGHLVLHAGVEPTIETIDKIERQANRFAGAFLLPRESFSREVLGTSISYFLSLKSRWRVAISAMVYRCRDLGIFSINQQSYLMRQMNSQRIREVEPLDDAFPFSPPSMLGQAFGMLIGHKVQTRSQIEGALGLNLQDVESICGLEIGFLDSRVVPLRLKQPE